MPENVWCDGEDDYVPSEEVRDGVHRPAGGRPHYVRGGGLWGGQVEEPPFAEPAADDE
jgi:hypothetical protein